MNGIVSSNEIASLNKDAPFFKDEISFPVSSVTIYPSSCRITRSKFVALKKGENRLTVNNLPHSLTEDSIRVEIEGSLETRVKDIFCEERALVLKDETEYSRMKREIEDISFEKKNLESAYSNLLNEIKLFTDKMQFREYIKEDMRPVINPKSWASFLSLFREKLEKNKNNTRETIFKLIEINEKIKTLQANLAKYKSSEKSRERVVTIIIDSEVDAQKKINIYYLQENVSWYPSYFLRSYPERNSIEVNMFAMVKQETGEEWKDVDIILSTANPMFNCAIPQIRSKIIKEESAQIIDITPSPCDIDECLDMEEEIKCDKLVSEKSIPRMFAKSASLKGKIDVKYEEKKKKEEKLSTEMDTLTGGAGIPPPSVKAVSDVKPPVTEILLSGKGVGSSFSLNALSHTFREYYDYLYTDFAPEVKMDTSKEINFSNYFLSGVSPSVSLGGYDYRYRISNKSDIPSINVPVKLGVDTRRFNLEPVYVTVPFEKENIYLKGKFINNGVSPFPAGPAGVFIGNQFLGNITLSSLALNQSASLSLGIERDIKVLRRERSERRVSGGFIGSDIITDYTIEIELQSFKEQNVKIEVYDRLPLSQKEKEIFIIDEKFDVKPTKITKRKIIFWEIYLIPQEKKSIKFYYSIKHAENYRLTMTKSQTPYYETEE